MTNNGGEETNWGCVIVAILAILAITAIIIVGMLTGAMR